MCIYIYNGCKGLSSGIKDGFKFNLMYGVCGCDAWKFIIFPKPMRGHEFFGLQWVLGCIGCTLEFLFFVQVSLYGAWELLGFWVLVRV